VSVPRRPKFLIIDTSDMGKLTQEKEKRAMVVTACLPEKTLSKVFGDSGNKFPIQKLWVALSETAYIFKTLWKWL
jgi:hypothetical protein